MRTRDCGVFFGHWGSQGWLMLLNVLLDTGGTVSRDTVVKVEISLGSYYNQFNLGSILVSVYLSTNNKPLFDK